MYCNNVCYSMFIFTLLCFKGIWETYEAMRRKQCSSVSRYCCIVPSLISNYYYAYQAWGSVSVHRAHRTEYYYALLKNEFCLMKIDTILLIVGQCSLPLVVVGCFLGMDDSGWLGTIPYIHI